MTAAVRVRGLRKRYGAVLAVADISFSVRAGEIFGLLGPNGSGKTTTVECIQGLRAPDAGGIDVLGLDPRRDAARVRRLVGSQLQNAALPDRLRVWEALRLFSVAAPGGPPWQRLLADWGLEAQRDAAFGDLSGGQRQRLFVALALVNDPRVVILDEMTTGLDPAARRVAWELVEQIRGRGTTVILATHFMDEAERLCDRVAVVRAGRIAATGTPEELIASQHPDAVVSFTAPSPNGAGPVDIAALGRLRGVGTVERDGRQVTVRGRGSLLARVAHALVEQGAVPEDLAVERPTLEDAYLRLTGNDGRPAGPPLPDLFTGRGRRDGG